MSLTFKIGNLYVGHLCDLLAQPQELLRRGGEDRELPPTRAWQQFPALLSAPALSKEFSLRQHRKIEIPNKTDRRNIEIAPRYMRNWERGRSVSFMGIHVSNFWYSADSKCLKR
jgi:hypothetical protein